MPRPLRARGRAWSSRSSASPHRSAAGCSFCPVFAIARHVYLMKRRSAGRRLRFEESLAAEAKSNDLVRDDLRTLVEKDEVRVTLKSLLNSRNHRGMQQSLSHLMAAYSRREFRLF